MAEGDLTEYEFANKYLDSWEHWKMLCECTWFKPYLERWREELYLKEAAKALRQIKALSKSSSRDAFQAQRYLLEKGWMPKEEKAKRGRPSQDEVKKAAKEIATDESRILEDLKRIGQNKELIN